MISLWSDNQFKSLENDLIDKEIHDDLIERIYTTRLLGQDSNLVLHGGGNTSLKTKDKDVTGKIHDVLRIKGSGWDMSDIQPAGLPSVKLDPLLKLKNIKSITDQEMVNYVRSNLLDINSPNPSVESLLHAFLPHKFIDHTHASAILSLTNQKKGINICKEILGDSTGIVPYVMPGFELAKKALHVYEQNRKITSLILMNHGIFTFASNAKESYENMIFTVNKFEDYINKNRKNFFIPNVKVDKYLPVSEVASIIRGACTFKDEFSFDGISRFIVTFRSNHKILNYVNGKDLSRYSQVGVVTPDHIIRTKHIPLLLSEPILSDKNKFKEEASIAVKKFVKEYKSYFIRNNIRYELSKSELDPIPRVVLVKGIGLFALGRSLKEANIAADIAENTIDIITDSESLGGFESISESDLFDVEYWSLEQAKLLKGSKLPFDGVVVVVTGGGGEIGSAVSELFVKYGAHVAVLDINYNLAKSICSNIGRNAFPFECDVTNNESVVLAFENITKFFGGIDIVVSNAGAAWEGKIGEVDDSILRESFEINFFSHQTVASNAVKVMKNQNMGGVLLFNISKQAINPGLNFGPYGLPKAATLFLVRQYALDHASDGIRSNAVNPDRIRSGILNNDLISSRSKARGLTEKEYMTANLLGKEIKAKDVALAFVHQALQSKTTADVTTVDGGNISAILR